MTDQYFTFAQKKTDGYIQPSLSQDNESKITKIKVKQK